MNVNLKLSGLYSSLFVILFSLIFQKNLVVVGGGTEKSLNNNDDVRSSSSTDLALDHERGLQLVGLVAHLAPEIGIVGAPQQQTQRPAVQSATNNNNHINTTLPPPNEGSNHASTSPKLHQSLFQLYTLPNKFRECRSPKKHFGSEQDASSATLVPTLLSKCMLLCFCNKIMHSSSTMSMTWRWWFLHSVAVLRMHYFVAETQTQKHTYRHQGRH